MNNAKYPKEIINVSVLENQELMIAFQDYLEESKFWPLYLDIKTEMIYFTKCN